MGSDFVNCVYRQFLFDIFKYADYGQEIRIDAFIAEV